MHCRCRGRHGAKHLEYRKASPSDAQHAPDRLRRQQAVGLGGGSVRAGRFVRADETRAWTNAQCAFGKALENCASDEGPECGAPLPAPGVDPATTARTDATGSDAAFVNPN